MTIDKEPLNDDELDKVSGGASVNGGCDTYQWDTVNAYDGSCSSCLLKQLGACPYGN